MLTERRKPFGVTGARHHRVSYRDTVGLAASRFEQSNNPMRFRATFSMDPRFEIRFGESRWRVWPIRIWLAACSRMRSA